MPRHWFHDRGQLRKAFDQLADPRLVCPTVAFWHNPGVQRPLELGPIMAHCRRLPATGFRSAYRRLTDLRG